MPSIMAQQLSDERKTWQWLKDTYPECSDVDMNATIDKLITDGCIVTQEKLDILDAMLTDTPKIAPGTSGQCLFGCRLFCLR